ncbi:MAG: ABC transporter ATP-binding protein [Kiloniellales bacterium]
MSAPTVLLKIAGLTKSFGGLRALDSLSFDVGAGEVVAVIGPNGAGKSTCFNLIGGQLAADSGSIELEGRAIGRLPAHARVPLGLARTFQIAGAFSSLTLAENLQVALAIKAKLAANLVRGGSQLFKEEALALLERVELAARADQRSGALPYGDLKRLELAIALAAQPRLLLLDEPTAGLAGAERHLLMKLAVSEAQQRGLAVLFTEHDVDLVFTFAERILVLDRGRRIAEGKPDAVRGDPRVRAIYLGSDAVAS